MSMNIQRFHAPTAREALALARAAFGDGTLILSNRQVPTGVEVIAAAESELSALDASTPSASSAPSAPVAEERRPAPPQASARTTTAPIAEAAAPKPEPSTQELVRADTEQLSMSTLSFQDYVRERMLRRQHESHTGTREASAAQPAMPEPIEAQPAPVVQAAPAPVATATALAIDLPIDLPIDVREEAQPAPSAIEQAPRAATDLSKTLMAELQNMKALMEDRFNMLAWLGQAKSDPIHSNLMLKLVRAGYSSTLARSVLQPIEVGADPATVVGELMATLERMLAIDPATPSLAEEGGIFALVGATGVGKTTTAAKLAAQCARLHGPASVGLVTLDIHRAGAHEQLRAYGRSLGMVAHLAHDRAALQELLTLLSGKKMVLVDTAGFAPRDPRRRDMLDMLDLPQVKRVLVLNAGAHGDTLDETAASFKIGGARTAVLSKVDEAVKLGPAIDVLIRHQLTLRGVANGQRIPHDWKAANAAELVRDSMRAAQRSHFDPRSADLDFFYSPSECTV